MEMQLDFIAWASLVGVLLPLLISAIKLAEWSDNVKKVVAAAISLGAAVILTGAELGWSPDSLSELWQLLVPAFAGIFALAQTTYSGFWKGQPIETRIADFSYRKAA